MYESYWQLTKKPFEDGGDLGCYYPSETHQGTLLKLRYAVENRRAAALLAGPSGTGKTLLVRQLRRLLADSFTPVAHLVFTRMPVAELFGLLSHELGLPSPDAAPLGDSVRRIQGRLIENAAAGRHALVVVDEAHLLDGPTSLETLRLLLNIESAAGPALTLLLVGLPAILPTLERMPHLDERLAVKCLLRPLSQEETIAYVSHRLTAAGATGEIFDIPALDRIFELTRGVPRRINRLCDLALLIGFAGEQKRIGAEQVDAVADEVAVA